MYFIVFIKFSKLEIINISILRFGYMYLHSLLNPKKIYFYFRFKLNYHNIKTTLDNT